MKKHSVLSAVILAISLKSALGGLIQHEIPTVVARPRAVVQPIAFSVVDPIRTVGKGEVSATGGSWVIFTGHVLQSTNGIVTVEGYYAANPEGLRLFIPRTFDVYNFPYPTRKRQFLSGFGGAYFSAMLQNDGNLNYWKLPDFSFKQKSSQQKSIDDQHLMKWLNSQATNGSASAECSLGEHYLKGDCCETNKDLAIKWLTLATSNGDIEASNKLVSLQSATTNSTLTAN